MYRHKAVCRLDAEPCEQLPSYLLMEAIICWLRANPLVWANLKLLYFLHAWDIAELKSIMKFDRAIKKTNGLGLLWVWPALRSLIQDKSFPLGSPQWNGVLTCCIWFWFWVQVCKRFLLAQGIICVLVFKDINAKCLSSLGTKSGSTRIVDYVSQSNHYKSQHSQTPT